MVEQISNTVHPLCGGCPYFKGSIIVGYDNEEDSQTDKIFWL